MYKGNEVFKQRTYAGEYPNTGLINEIVVRDQGVCEDMSEETKAPTSGKSLRMRLNC